MKTTTIHVEGMHCLNCVAKIKKALETLEGIDSVTASVEEKQVTINHDGREGAEACFIREIEILDDHKFSVVRA